jgi:hypothetical protein
VIGAQVFGADATTWAFVVPKNLIHQELALILEDAVWSDNVHIEVLLLGSAPLQEHLIAQDAL